MLIPKMTPFQRVMTALSHQEPDRVPFFLLLTMHGAKELSISIEDYFSKAEHVVNGQLLMQRKYGHDCIYTFFYAAIEVEAWGGEIVYTEDGSPNSGRPFIRSLDAIKSLEPPRPDKVNCLVKVLEATTQLKLRVGNNLPIIGVVMSPFSLPAMQLGFDKYIELLYEQGDLFWQLMRVNSQHCVDWANAQLAAGATAICYFDPLSSSDIIPRDLYIKTGYKVAKQALSQIKGPTATHLASGRALPISNLVSQTGTAAIGISALDELSEVKEHCKDRLSILGNLNGIAMTKWTTQQAEEAVKNAICKAGKGGGFILADNHGEIPYQVSDQVLMAISESVRTWGQYPLDWVNGYEK
ncbi:uroporphyrinogen decarboxylase family protein [Dethiobacter alkaliphilus]|uniref:Uroporphyrinogen decarboxylase (URO-D) n=1 Tax=Dethiobacter alkaliphilus AHT 1 TaxID=555088 RepID=C0GFF2_DETAL|nr:uroporphyrinogen decarboxylase family protein [Dethiobacter alkaliphilus]EEG77912.1 Uroporphyrinogen decarboxylase (URO-D) [Dethiobacter alkaliphilus AHT 1]